MLKPTHHSCFISLPQNQKGNNIFFLLIAFLIDLLSSPASREPRRGSQGCIQVWMAISSVRGFHSVTPLVSFGNTACIGMTAKTDGFLHSSSSTLTAKLYLVVPCISVGAFYASVCDPSLRFFITFWRSRYDTALFSLHFAATEKIV